MVSLSEGEWAKSAVGSNVHPRRVLGVYQLPATAITATAIRAAAAPAATAADTTSVVAVPSSAAISAVASPRDAPVAAVVAAAVAAAPAAVGVRGAVLHRRQRGLLRAKRRGRNVLRRVDAAADGDVLQLPDPLGVRVLRAADCAFAGPCRPARRLRGGRVCRWQWSSAPRL